VAEELVRTDPTAAEDLIGQVTAEAKSLVGDIRRLARCLGHSPLDQVGLVSAIRERARCIGGTGLGDATVGERGVTIEVAGDVEDLPAAAEVAAFHIVSEALAEALGNGNATSCHVRLNRLASDLEVEVQSDGCDPAADLRSGSRMGSMRERADELGGALSVESLSRGRTVLRARLPLHRN
jgi:two-component system NarL family sensor kinase